MQEINFGVWLQCFLESERDPTISSHLPETEILSGAGNAPYEWF